MKIELTEVELKVLKQQIEGEFSILDATDEERAAMGQVIKKADELMDELDAYNELQDSLMKWYLNKYEEQRKQR